MKNDEAPSMSLARPDQGPVSLKHKIALGLGSLGLFILALALFNVQLPNQGGSLAVALLLISIGIVIYANDLYQNKQAGINNNGVWFKSIASRGILGWITGIILTSFYVVLYFYPKLLGLGTAGEANSGLIAFFDPLSVLLNGNAASQWFVYGTLYTLAILLFGYKFLLKYRGNKYQQLRTFSVMFFQLGFESIFLNRQDVANVGRHLFHSKKMNGRLVQILNRFHVSNTLNYAWIHDQVLRNY